MLPLILEKYKQAEMSLNVKDINGHTPLFVAAIKGYYKLFDILIEAGSDINVQDIEGETILNWAILMHESRFATEILNNHPQLDVNIKNNQGTSALIIASNNGFTSLVQLILDISKLGNNRIAATSKLDVFYVEESEFEFQAIRKKMPNQINWK